MIRYTYLYDKAKNTQKELAIAQHELIYQTYKCGDINSARKHMENHYIFAVSQIQAGFPDELKS